MRFRSSILTLLTLASWAILAMTVGERAQANPFKQDIAEPGNVAYRQEDYSRATSEYLKAQDREPLSANLHFNLGAAYFQQEEYAKALEEFQQATRADDPRIAAGAFYNQGNARYSGAKREFEAAAAAGGVQQASGTDPVQAYVGKLEECLNDYQEALKRAPEDQDAKYNLEMVRREIKNLMRRDPNQQQPQNQDQQDNQDQNQQNQEQPQQEQNQEQQDQQKQEGQQQEQKDSSQQQDQPQQPQQGEQATPTPQGQGESQNPSEQGTPTPQPSGEQSGEPQEGEEQPEQVNISEEMAKTLLDNLPEQRPRQRRSQRRSVEKDW